MSLESPEIQSLLKKVRMLILDVDGIMTDGKIFWLDGHGFVRQFHVRDGYGIRMLQKAGIEVGVITAGEAPDIKFRAQFLGIRHAYFGDLDKLKILKKISDETGIAYSEIAYMGDDLPDIPVIEQVGFSASVPHAIEEVKSRVRYVTRTPGGHGAVREVAGAILKAKGIEVSY
ncbi:MAG: hypothetical protein A2583_11820 [Bdellovibrionales bacterium RIFOXYD1_FULL_53_11]|nr:MAG: hypothetical protein A2583_11820 [Bdellovibrionales bacterium RIFOXYD1_FULL_53_11]